MSRESTSHLTVSSLGSGSNGNAYLVEHGPDRLLVDAGIPARTLMKCLALRGVTPGDLTGVLVSHEHSDHVRALGSLIARAPLRVFSTAGTFAALGLRDSARTIPIRDGESFSVGDLSIRPFTVDHDANEPVGFAVSTVDSQVTFMTDLGKVTDQCAEMTASADLLIIESNYDEQMLRRGPYPAFVKQRIRSSVGHLSNDDCADFLTDVLTERTSTIWLAHLSKNNNAPDIAVERVRTSLRSRGHVRNLVALPRYNGEVKTWSSSQRPLYAHQPRLPFE